jgi:hypothetical protein
VGEWNSGLLDKRLPEHEIDNTVTWVPFEHTGALIQKFHKLKKEEQKAFQRPRL